EREGLRAAARVRRGTQLPAQAVGQRQALRLPPLVLRVGREVLKDRASCLRAREESIARGRARERAVDALEVELALRRKRADDGRKSPVVRAKLEGVRVDDVVERADEVDLTLQVRDFSGRAERGATTAEVEGE